MEADFLDAFSVHYILDKFGYGAAKIPVALAPCLLSGLYADYILLRYYGDSFWIFFGRFVGAGDFAHRDFRHANIHLAEHN